MADKITVGSRSHMAFSISEAPADPSKPGAMEMMSTVLNGSNHPKAVGGVGVTRNVDAEMFRAWHKAQKEAGNPLASHVFEMSDDDVKKLDEPLEYGFEPALKRLSEGENADLAAKGSTITYSGPVSSVDMAATSDTPNDDTPRGDPDLVPTVRTQTPATAMVAGSDKDADAVQGGTTPAPASPAKPIVKPA